MVSAHELDRFSVMKAAIVISLCGFVHTIDCYEILNEFWGAGVFVEAPP